MTTSNNLNKQSPYNLEEKQKNKTEPETFLTAGYGLGFEGSLETPPPRSSKQIDIKMHILHQIHLKNYCFILHPLQ